MTTPRQKARKDDAARHQAAKERVQKARVQQGDPRACWDESQTGGGKSSEQQRRDSKLEAGRPKDTGRCG